MAKHDLVTTFVKSASEECVSRNKKHLPFDESLQKRKRTLRFILLRKPLVFKG
jgi:hypothetical protein